MSRENVQMIERLLARAPDDPAALWEMFDDDARWEVGDLDPLEAGATWRGPAGVREFFRRWVGAFDDWGYEVEEAIDAGDSVVVHIRQWGRGKASGAPVENRFWQVWTIRDGKIVRGTHHVEKDEALEAAASPGNVQRARQVMDALGRRDAEALIALSDPDVEWRPFFAIGEGGAYRGYEGIGRYVDDLGDAWESVRADVDDALGLGDVTVLVGRIHYRGRGSGVESESPAGWMLKFREGKLMRFRAFREPEQALEAVGD